MALIATPNPNPLTNPGMKLRCNNCDHMTPDPSTGLSPGATIWNWHTPYGTYVGSPEEMDKTRLPSTDIPNSMHPHCPTCGSHSVTVIETL